MAISAGIWGFGIGIDKYLDSLTKTLLLSPISYRANCIA